MRNAIVAVLLGAVAIGASFAQVPVAPAPDHSVLLQSADPKLAQNKRLVYDFWREVFEAGQLELAEKYMAETYIQHNPNVPTGRAAFVEFFGKGQETQAHRGQGRGAARRHHRRRQPGRSQLRAGTDRPEGSVEEVHDDMVRHVPHRGRKDRRALGSRRQAMRPS
jgi:hypothetical protein